MQSSHFLQIRLNRLIAAFSVLFLVSACNKMPSLSNNKSDSKSETTANETQTSSGSSATPIQSNGSDVESNHIPYSSVGIIIKGGSIPLKTPYGVAVDKFGTIFVADTFNHQIQVFGSDGSFLRRFGSEGSNRDQFYYPESLAIDSHGILAVQDAGNSRVVEIFGKNDPNIKIFDLPGSMPAFDLKGNLYFADSAKNRILVMKPNGVVIRSFDGSSSGLGALNNPQGITLDASGNIYVSDQGNARVMIFDNEGNFLKTFGSNGFGDGQFLDAQSIAVDPQGDIIVADPGTKIQVFDKEGTFLRGIPGAGVYRITVDTVGNLYAVYSDGNQVVQFLY